MNGYSYLIETGASPKYELSRRYYNWAITAGEAGLRRAKKYWPNFVNVWYIEYTDDEQMPVCVDYKKFLEEKLRKRKEDSLRLAAERKNRRIAGRV